MPIALRIAALLLVLHGVSQPVLGGPFGRARPCDLALLCACAAVALVTRTRVERASLSWLAAALTFALSLPFAAAIVPAAAQLAVLAYVGVLFALGRELGRSDVSSEARKAFVIGAALCGLAGIVGVASDLLLGDALGLARRYPFIVTAPRATGPTESPSMLGTVVSCGLVVLASLHRRGTLPRVHAVAMAGVMGTALLLTQSRSLLDLVAAIAVVVAVHAAARARRVAITVAALAIALLVLTLRYRFAPLSPAFPFFDTHPSLYALCHDVALRVFAEHPMTGVGLEGFGAAWPKYFDASRYGAHLAGLTDHMGPLDPHSTYLGFLAETGLLVCVPFALFVAGALRLARTASPELRTLLVFTAVTALHMDVLTNRAIAIAIGLLAGSVHLVEVRNEIPSS